MKKIQLALNSSSANNKYDAEESEEANDDKDDEGNLLFPHSMSRRGLPMYFSPFLPMTTIIRMKRRNRMWLFRLQ